MRTKNLFFAFIFSLFALAASAHTDDTIFPRASLANDAALGAEVSYFGYCPCFRWKIRVELAGGEIETRELLISSEALFQFMQTENTQWHAREAQLFRIGAIEALVKGAHVGIGFSGVTLGQDADAGYTNIIKTGVYLLINIFRTEAARLDLKTGYEFDQYSVNAAPTTTRNITSQAIAFRWNTTRFFGKITGSVFLDAENYSRFNVSHIGYTASAAAGVKFFNVRDFYMGAELQASYSHDPFRFDLGLDPNLAVAGIFIDVGYEPIFRKKK